MTPDPSTGKWTLHFTGQIGTPETFRTRWAAESRAEKLMLSDYAIRWEKKYVTRMNERMRHAIQAVASGYKIEKQSAFDADWCGWHYRIRFPNGEMLKLRNEDIHKLLVMKRITDDDIVSALTRKAD